MRGKIFCCKKISVKYLQLFEPRGGSPKGSCVEKICERKKLIGKYLQFQGGGSDEVYR